MLRLSILVLLLAGTALARQAPAIDPFWVESSEELGSKEWRVFLPADKKMQGQGYLVFHTLPATETPLSVREVLAVLYSEVEDLKILGQKKVAWKDGEGSVVSFSGRHGKKRLLGRAVLGATREGTEILLLVRHPRADKKLLENFERVRSSWPALLSQ